MLKAIYEQLLRWNKKWIAFKFRLIFQRKNIKIGRNFQCDSFPTIIVEPTAQLSIGNDVIFRKDVEIRVHGISTLIIGSNVRVDRGTRLLSSNKAKLEIGDGTRIGLLSVFNGGDNITVGKKCLISGFVYLQTSMHRHGVDKSIQDQGYDHAPIVLGDDVWLGAHAVVLPGCEIGYGAIVGSNSVVTKSVNANTIVAGAPAKPLRSRD